MHDRPSHAPGFSDPVVGPTHSLGRQPALLNPRGKTEVRAQLRLHQLDAVGVRANLCPAEGQADVGLSLSRVERHRRCRASGEGRPAPVGLGIVLERVLLAGNRLSEILAEREAGADYRQVQKGPSAIAAAPIAALQVVVGLVRNRIACPCVGPSGHGSCRASRQLMTKADLAADTGVKRAKR